MHPLVLRPRRDFPVVQWFYADALCDAHGCQPFDERFWAVVRPYMRDLVEHFQDTIYVPVFTPPLDGPLGPTTTAHLMALHPLRIVVNGAKRVSCPTRRPPPPGSPASSAIRRSGGRRAFLSPCV